MSVQAEAYFETQTRLTAWTDELEFLGYILCELIDADGLSTRGYRCHQAADLPAIVDIVRLQLKEPNGSLAKVMKEDELKTLRQLLTKAKQMGCRLAGIRFDTVGLGAGFVYGDPAGLVPASRQTVAERVRQNRE